MPSASASEFIVGGGTHRVAEAGGGGGRGDQLCVPGQSISPADLSFLAMRVDGPGPVRSPLYQPFSIGPTRQRDGWYVRRLPPPSAVLAWFCRSRWSARRRRWGSRTAISTSAQVLARLRSSMAVGRFTSPGSGELGTRRRIPPASQDPLLYALREKDVMAVAGRQVGARLGDQDRLACPTEAPRASNPSSAGARCRARSCRRCRGCRTMLSNGDRSHAPNTRMHRYSMDELVVGGWARWPAHRRCGDFLT